MKTTFMNVSRGVIGALAFSLGISSCQSSQSKSCFHDNMVFLLSNVIAVFTVANIAEISATGY